MNGTQGAQRTPRGEVDLDRYRGCLLGLAVGDAVGTTVEFRPRGSFEPVTDLVGGGPFNLPAGAWTDDTSMALCLADSLLSCDGFDPIDQLQRYCEWRDSGLWSSTGRCFDIGTTVAGALSHFIASGDPSSGPTDPRSAGNGSLMRLAPVPMFYGDDVDQAVEFAGASSLTTHGAEECVDACRYYASLLVAALGGASKAELLRHHPHAQPSTENVAAIAAGDYLRMSREQIRGTGYVIDALRAALWCFARHDDYRSAILEATNLGDDADTTAAICGQLAGAHLGESGIPVEWLDRLVKRDEIGALAERLAGQH